MKMNPVVHFEMPAKDKDRVRDFYSKAFGWNMQQLGPEMGNYILAGTTETDEDQMVKTPGTINGGFFEYKQSLPSDEGKDEESYNATRVVISVDDLNKSIEDVKTNGGQILGEPMDIPGVGKYISFKDSEDNIVGMLQPAQM